MEFKISKGTIAEFHACKIMSLHIDGFTIKISSRTTDITVSSYVAIVC